MNEGNRKRRAYSAPEISHVELNPEESLSVGCKQDPGPVATDFKPTVNGCVVEQCYSDSGS